ncbi:hypothetical protein GCM10028777_38490 [Angustibacter speluncae]
MQVARRRIVAQRLVRHVVQGHWTPLRALGRRPMERPWQVQRGTRERNRAPRRAHVGASRRDGGPSTWFHRGTGAPCGTRRPAGTAKQPPTDRGAHTPRGVPL